MHMFQRVMKGIYQFVANLLSYIPTKHYWNRSTCDLVIAKSKRVNFFLKHSVYRRLAMAWGWRLSSVTFRCCLKTIPWYHSVFTTWKWHPFATWTPSFIILVRKLKKNLKNTNGRLAIPALAGLLVSRGGARAEGQKYIICNRLYISVALFSKNRPIYDCHIPGWSVWRLDRESIG